MLKKIIIALAIALPAAFAHADDAKIRVGLLTCDVGPGVGLVITSTPRDVSCRFDHGNRTEYYSGDIKTLGLDLGVTVATKIVWIVSAISDESVRDSQALAGTYVGGTVSISAGVGGGVNGLVGLLDRGITLQPLSGQVQGGINFTAAGTKLELY